jgi:hypothetical protein
MHRYGLTAIAVSAVIAFFGELRLRARVFGTIERVQRDWRACLVKRGPIQEQS